MRPSPLRFAFAVLASLLAAAAPSAEPAKHPNVVIILADDLGYGDVACYNPERGKIPTPHVDALAKEGMRFIDAHMSSSLCSPSRYGLLTGRYHWRTHLQSGVVGACGSPLITRDRPTIASLAKQAGYRTACIGKWHLGWDWPIAKDQMKSVTGLGMASTKFETEATPEQIATWKAIFSKQIPGGPTARGFDQYFGTDVPNWPPYCFIENDRTVGIPSTVLPAELLLKGHLASMQGPAMPDWKLDVILPTVVDHACAIIKAQAGATQPLLLYLPLTAPHTPIAVTEEWRGKSGLNSYADFVMETDAMVGRVLDAIKTAAPDTLVLFSSDNGFASYAGREELEKKGHFPSGPLRGYKADAWEGGHRLPFIVRWPGTVAPGTVCAQTICTTDVFATLAEILGEQVPPNAGEDSVSLMPLLRGEDKPLHEAVVHGAGSGVIAIRSGKWKAIFGPGSGPPKADAKPLLYDLEADLGETKDLAAEHPEEVTRLTTMLLKIVHDGRSTPGPAQKNEAPVRNLPKAEPGEKKAEPGEKKAEQGEGKKTEQSEKKTEQSEKKAEPGEKELERTDQ